MKARQLRRAERMGGHYRGSRDVSSLQRFDPREVAHLAAGPCLRLAVEVDHRVWFGREHWHKRNIVTDQIFHDSV